MTAEFRGLIDLAAAAYGGVAILANDEFFAEKDNLLRAHAAVWKEHEYTDRGKWMDGWETRRRREPGHDWCIIRLGLPGVVRGVVVDTAFFRGNFPAECSIDACTITGPDLAAALDPSTKWTPILRRSPLKGDTQNEFGISGEQRFTHLRLNIFPDGGVARLRVHGEVRPDWARLSRHGGLIDLAAVEHGGWSESCSDMFFGARQNLIAPGRPINMSDGWETRRRRGPGHDWNLIRLGAAGTIRRVELDTTHFRGNAPGRVMIEAESFDGEWRVLLPETPVQAHTVHSFEDQLRVLGEVRRVRLNVIPCGGVARLRVFAEVASELSTAIERLNQASDEEAQAVLLACCGAPRWAAYMAAQRPFEDAPALLRAADWIWWRLREADHLAAFAAHPRIGERKAEHDTGAQAAAWSAGEQSTLHHATTSVRERLAAANVAYFERFGFSFIVCATGKTADEMLTLLESRLGNSHAIELRTAAEEQAKISRLRLEKFVEGR